MDGSSIAIAGGREEADQDYVWLYVLRNDIRCETEIVMEISADLAPGGITVMNFAQEGDLLFGLATGAEND